MPKCTILVGVPGSGKSTWLLGREHIEDQYIASTDDIIEAIAFGFGLTYDEGFKDLIKFAEKVMWKELADFAEDGERIYVDRTNLSVKSRKRFMDFLRPYGYEFDAVVFATPKTDEWAKRLHRPGKTIPDHVLESMADNIEMPTKAEGFINITHIG
jgi:predicted kinase